VYIKSTLHSWTESIMTSTKRTSSRPPGLQIGNYQLRETIGIGAFGKVKVGQHVQTGVKVAVKD
jgi:5'-AMP-activated protein kinase catalytic alpha subunit